MTQRGQRPQSRRAKARQKAGQGMKPTGRHIRNRARRPEGGAKQHSKRGRKRGMPGGRRSKGREEGERSERKARKNNKTKRAQGQGWGGEGQEKGAIRGQAGRRGRNSDGDKMKGRKNRLTAKGTWRERRIKQKRTRREKGRETRNEGKRQRVEAKAQNTGVEENTGPDCRVKTERPKQEDRRNVKRSPSRARNRRGSTAHGQGETGA